MIQLLSIEYQKLLQKYSYRKRNQHLGDIYYITKCLEGKKLIKRGGKYEQYY